PVDRDRSRRNPSPRSNSDPPAVVPRPNPPARARQAQRRRRSTQDEFVRTWVPLLRSSELDEFPAVEAPDEPLNPCEILYAETIARSILEFLQDSVGSCEGNSHAVSSFFRNSTCHRPDSSAIGCCATRRAEALHLGRSQLLILACSAGAAERER